MKNCRRSGVGANGRGGEVYIPRRNDGGDLGYIFHRIPVQMIANFTRLSQNAPNNTYSRRHNRSRGSITSVDGRSST